MDENGATTWAEEKAENIDLVKAKMAVKRNSKGEAVGIQQTWDNVDIVLENDARFKGRLSYNEVDRKIYKIQPFPWDDKTNALEPVDDYDILQLQRLIQRDYGQKPDDVKKQYIGTAMKHKFNPIKDLLEALEWDGKEHIRYLMPKYLGVDDDEYQYKALRLTMLALIERQYRPGAKDDCVLALNGAQGLGKSTFCKMLAFNNDAYFTDGLTDLTDKDTLQIVSGKRVIEFGEMLSLKKTKEKEAVKRFISATQDTFRAPYASTYQDYPRQCIIIATTNEFEYLDDLTGSRRWLPIECRAEKVPDKMAIQHAQKDFFAAWAEAMHDWRELRAESETGEIDLVGMSYELADEAKEHASMHEETDPYEGIILQYLEGLAAGSDSPRTCALEIATMALSIDKPTRFELKDIARIIDNRATDWVRNPNRQRCGIYGRQTCWDYEGKFMKPGTEPGKDYDEFEGIDSQIPF